MWDPTLTGQRSNCWWNKAVFFIHYSKYECLDVFFCHSIFTITRNKIIQCFTGVFTLFCSFCGWAIVCINFMSKTSHLTCCEIIILSCLLLFFQKKKSFVYWQCKPSLQPYYYWSFHLIFLFSTFDPPWQTWTSTQRLLLVFMFIQTCRPASFVLPVGYLALSLSTLSLSSQDRTQQVPQRFRTLSIDDVSWNVCLWYAWILRHMVYG